MNYTISPNLVTLPENIESAEVRIKGWSNKRTLYMDSKAQVSYLQITSEGNGCGRCGLCLEKMNQVGWKSNFEFLQIRYGWGIGCNLYQKLSGVPKDTTVESLSEFLGLQCD